MNRRSKRDRRHRKREAKQAAARARAYGPPVVAHASGGPCSDAGSGMGEPCPRCGKREVKVHTCACCDDACLRCCACCYVLSESEAEPIGRACAERDSTGTGQRR
jgi:hypothetical protein